MPAWAESNSSRVIGTLPVNIPELFKDFHDGFLGYPGLHTATGNQRGRLVEPVDTGVKAVAIALVLAQILVQPSRELTAKYVVEQHHSEVVRVASGYSRLSGLDHRLSRPGLVHQVYGRGVGCGLR